MLQQGYSFHFTKEKSWILTPEMEALDFIERGGLFWLKWQKSIDPSTQLADYGKYCADVASGVAERLKRTLVEHAACIMHEAGLAREFWSLAVKHITWVRNRLWHKALNGPN